MTKTICLDARLWGIKNTGIGRYTENLIDNLPQENNCRVVLILPKNLKTGSKLGSFEKHYARFHPYSIFSQFEMLYLLHKIRPDLLHVPHFTIPVLWRGKIVVTIHDLIKHISKGPDTTTRFKYLYWFKLMGYYFIVKQAIFRSVHIIVPANYWKREILKRYEISEDKISVTYEGVDTKLFSPLGKSTQISSEDSPYVLYAGNVYPHKNIPVLLSAVGLLKGQVRLVIVCARNVFWKRLSEMVKAMHITHLVIFKNYLEDSELANLYRHSLAFVFPSLIEGFGLPGLEAMAAGVPVIAAKSSSLPEIYGNAALYFDPFNPLELSRHISDMIVHPRQRNKYITLGLHQISKYSWQLMAQKTWQIYQNALQ